MTRIVVGIDGSAHAERALQWAIEEAKLRGGSVHAVHAWHYPYVGVADFPVPAFSLEDIEAAARAVLDAAVDVHASEGVEITRRLVSGPAAQALLEAAEGADLVVVGSRGHGGFTGLLLGSVSQQLAHHTPCPVVILPAEH